jgi:hypothetical protein
MVPLDTPGFYLLETRFPQEYFHGEPFLEQLSPEEPKGTIFFEIKLLEKRGSQ